nr:MAG: hypothetical protein [Botourmiaviridae sp.]
MSFQILFGPYRLVIENSPFCGEVTVPNSRLARLLGRSCPDHSSKRKSLVVQRGSSGGSLRRSSVVQSGSGAGYLLTRRRARGWWQWCCRRARLNLDPDVRELRVASRIHTLARGSTELSLGRK